MPQPLCCLLVLVAAVADPQRLARDYAAAVEAVNRAHADKPVAKDEDELAKKLPASAAKLVASLVAEADSPATREALATAAHAALELDRIEDFDALRQRLDAIAPAAARELGLALSRPRFVVIATGGVEQQGLTRIADVFDRVLDAYAEVFGLTSFSKMPGKKLRLRIELVPAITRPPHFAPELPWHSEIWFPVVDGKEFRSPTADGKFLFYGLCHELGHVIAMWGDQKNEEDRHAWAHYTGVAIVEHLTKQKADGPLQDLRDVRWKSVEFERKRLAAQKVAPAGKDADTVLARLLALHDAVGPRAIGEALNALDAANKNLRINRVRYYAMRDFEQALLATKEGRAKKKEVEAAFADR